MNSLRIRCQLYLYNIIVKHRKKKEIDEFLHEEEDFDLDYFGDEFWDEDLDDDDEVVKVSPEIAEKVAKYHEAAECLLEELEKGTYGN